MDGHSFLGLIWGRGLEVAGGGRGGKGKRWEDNPPRSQAVCRPPLLMFTYVFEDIMYPLARYRGGYVVL